MNVFRQPTLPVLINTFAFGKCERTHLPELINTFAFGKCERAHLPVLIGHICLWQM